MHRRIKRHGIVIKRRIGRHILALKRHSFWRGVFTGSVFAILLILFIEWLLVFDQWRGTVPELQCLLENLVDIDEIPINENDFGERNDYGTVLDERELRAAYKVKADPAWRVPIELSSPDFIGDDVVPGSPKPESVEGVEKRHRIAIVHTDGGLWRNVRANPTDIREHTGRLLPLLRGMGLTSPQAKAIKWRIKRREGGGLLYMTDSYSYAPRSGIYFLPTFTMSFGANGVAHGMKAHLGKGLFTTGTVYQFDDIWVSVMEKCGNLVRVIPTDDGGCVVGDSDGGGDGGTSVIHEPAVLGLLGFGLGILAAAVFLRRGGRP